MVIYRMNEFEPIELRTREKITSPTKVATTIAAIWLSLDKRKPMIVRLL